MIFRKGEMVKVVADEEFLDPCVREFSGCIGRVFLVDKLTNPTPFIVQFIVNDELKRGSFSYKEIVEITDLIEYEFQIYEYRRLENKYRKI